MARRAPFPLSSIPAYIDQSMKLIVCLLTRLVGNSRQISLGRFKVICQIGFQAPNWWSNSGSKQDTQRSKEENKFIRVGKHIIRSLLVMTKGP